MSEREIVKESERYLKSKGVESFWYHGIGAFVFTGERTTISISGKEYQATDIRVQSEDLVTVDLSPVIGDCWGDYARTFVISDGKVKGINSDELDQCSQEIYKGIRTEEILHVELLNTISEDHTFEEIFIKMNSLIEELGYENLDFAKNLGHTIEKDKDSRLYIESGNKTKLKDVDLFTFEPHIRKKDGKYGFKRENIYYFQNGKLKAL